MSRFLHSRLRAAVASACFLAIAGSVQANPKIYARALASTGWVVDHDKKLVITSAHLIKKSQEVLVYFPQRVDGKLKVDVGHYLHGVAAIPGCVISSDD